jgi:hypothetical protein
MSGFILLWPQRNGGDGVFRGSIPLLIRKFFLYIFREFYWKVIDKKNYISIILIVAV